jgi:hypothetical protein
VDTQYVEVAIPAKVWWASKTLWTQILGVVIQVGFYAIDPQARLGLSDQAVSIIRLTLFILQAVLTMIFRVMPENKPIAATRNRIQFASLPKAELTRPPERPATGPQHWGKD